MCATCFVQPIDMVKTRIQALSGDNPGTKYTPANVSKMLWAEGGLNGFYRGLDAALMRQLFY